MTRYSNILIRASAGTGKTFQLSNRFLGLLNSGAPLDQILATTFTRKAAGEILDRVIQRLAEAAMDDEQCEELSEFLEDDTLSRARCLLLLKQLTANLHRLRICTLDSFFSQIASSFALELGLPPGWRIIEPIHDQQLRKEAIDRLLRDPESNAVGRILNLMTKGDANRSVSALVRTTVNDLYSLFLETGPDAWRRFPQTDLLDRDELRSAIDSLANLELPSDKRIVEANLKSTEAAEAGHWEQFVSSGLAKAVLQGKTTYYKKEIEPPVYEAYARLAAHARDFIINQLANQTAATHELLERFDGYYRRLKFESRAMCFEDVTRVLANRGDLEQVDRLEHRLDTQLSHLLFDEFQDTSLVQWQVVRPFAERVTDDGGQQSFFFDGGQQSFFCVGDVKQAIYGWRGGKSEIFDALEAQLDDLDHRSLTKSFRSAPPIIDTVNRLFSRIDKHSNLADLAPAVEKWKAGFGEHSTARTELAGYATLETVRQPEHGQQKLDVTLPYAAKRVANLAGDCEGATIGVLVRRNKCVARLIYELRRLGVPASEEGGNPLTDSLAVQNVMSLLRLGDHPGDLVARFHLRHSPLGKQLGWTDHNHDEDADCLSEAVRQRLSDDGYGPAIQHWVDMLLPYCDARDASRLYQLVELAYRYQPIATLRVKDFSEFVAAERISDPTTSRVRVMTIHQAKGLQFDIVVLPDLDANLIGQTGACVVGQSAPTEPIDRVCLHRNSDIRDMLPDELKQMFQHKRWQEMVESLCVLYVAATRPVHALHMIIAPAAQNEKHLNKTFAGLLRAALVKEGDDVSAEPQRLLFEYGDANWMDAAHSPPRKSRPGKMGKADQPARKRTIRLAPMQDGRRYGLDRTAPSGLEGGELLRVGDLLRIDNQGAMARGTAIHACFEQIDWLDDGCPDEDQLRHAVVGALTDTNLDADEIIRQFNHMLESPDIAAALRRGSYSEDEVRSIASLRLEVHNEKRFAVRDKNRMLSGAIDRLVMMYDQDNLVGAEVIDYKTDWVAPDDPGQLNDLVEHYRPQQEAYCDAVSKMFNLERNRISARLLLVGAGIVKDL
jgi:ATP-dependent exoDNAse (exonuclease V) beta subunit